MAERLYDDRDSEAQGDYYMRHVSAMTGEDLHLKSAIAGELAHRDIVIDSLRAALAERDKVLAEAREYTRMIASDARYVTSLRSKAQSAIARIDALTQGAQP